MSGASTAAAGTTQGQQRAAALRQAVMGVMSALAQAWDKGDAAAYAAAFEANADFIHGAGGRVTGRAQVQAAMKALFEGPYAGSKVAYGIERVKLLGTGVLAVFLRQKVTLGSNQTLLLRPTATLVRTDAGWKVSVLQATMVAGGRKASPAAAAASAEPAAEPKKAPAKKSSKKA